MSWGKALGLIGSAIAAGTASYFLGKESGRKEGDEAGYKRGVAKNAAEIAALKKKIMIMTDEASKRDDLIICAYALGISCARANGSLPLFKVETLHDFVFGVTKVETRSKEVQEKVREMTLNPPNLKTVWSLIKERGFDTPHHKSMFTDIVDVMASIEENPTKTDFEFVEIWNNLVAA